MVESGFINAFKVGILSAINGQKESHNPWETEKGNWQTTFITTHKCP